MFCQIGPLSLDRARILYLIILCTQHSATVLDLIITNSPGYFVDYGTFIPPANCDHSFIYGKIYISYEKRKAFKRHIWDFLILMLLN